MQYYVVVVSESIEEYEYVTHIIGGFNTKQSADIYVKQCTEKPKNKDKHYAVMTLDAPLATD